MRKINKVLLCSIIVLVTAGASLCLAGTQDYLRLSESQKSFNVDISRLTSFYNTLTPDEKKEQLKDWAFYGLLSQLNISRSAAAELFQDASPMRYAFLNNKARKDISEYRIKNISNKLCIVMVPGE